jgi:selenocysteine lyase/cysteine desulfurase
VWRDANIQCERWLHVPRGCAIFHIPHRNQHLIRSTVPTSHGFVPRGQTFKSPLPKPSFEQNDSEHSAFTKAVEKPEFVAKFEFVGTIDNSPYLCIPAALKWRESLGGEEVIRTYCQTLAGEAGKYVAEELGTEVLENGTGSLGRCCMSNVRLPIPVEKVYKVAAQSGIEKEDVGVMVRDWMKKLSHVEYGTFIVVFWYGNAWWTRLSAQVYLEMGDFEFMVSTLRAMCERVEKGEWAGGKGKL